MGFGGTSFCTDAQCSPLITLDNIIRSTLHISVVHHFKPCCRLVDVVVDPPSPPLLRPPRELRPTPTLWCVGGDQERQMVNESESCVKDHEREH